MPGEGGLGCCRRFAQAFVDGVEEGKDDDDDGTRMLASELKQVGVSAVGENLPYCTVNGDWTNRDTAEISR